MPPAGPACMYFWLWMHCSVMAVHLQSTICAAATDTEIGRPAHPAPFNICNSVLKDQNSRLETATRTDQRQQAPTRPSSEETEKNHQTEYEQFHRFISFQRVSACDSRTNAVCVPAANGDYRGSGGDERSIGRESVGPPTRRRREIVISPQPTANEDRPGG